MNMKDNKNLNILCIKRVYVAGKDGLFFDKEIIIKRSPDAYSSIELDQVRYIIYEIPKTGATSYYGIIGKCIKNGEKQSKYYFLRPLSNSAFNDILLQYMNKDKLQAMSQKESLEFFTNSKVFDHFKTRNLFDKFLKINYNIK